MGSFPSRGRFREAVARGNALLARHGHPARGTAEDLRAWLRTDTPYPNPEPGDLLASPFLVVHEIVEIAEAKRRGLRITRDVIIRNMVTINDAHLVAAQAEFDIARKEGDTAHLALRFADLRSWCEDPLLTPVQKAAYERFRDIVQGWLDTANRATQTEGL